MRNSAAMVDATTSSVSQSKLSLRGGLVLHAIIVILVGCKAG